MPRFLIELFESKTKEFEIFLTNHDSVDSFQKIGNSFLINVVCKKVDEYFHFNENLNDEFPMLNIHSMCKAKCRNDTDCLNIAKNGGFCSKHRE